MTYDSDAIVVGAGLAGLVAAAELVSAGRKVIVIDQEPEASLGGQAYWSFGGLFFVDSPEQRRLGIRDSRELALRDWMATAAFDRDSDDWSRRWAEKYVDFAAGEARSWLHERGMRWFPIVGWAERRGDQSHGPGNSVPRFHITWGTGPGVLAPFERRAREAEANGRLSFLFRHRVIGLGTTGGAVDGVFGDVLEPSRAERGTPSSRTPTGEFELHAPATIVTTGGIGGNHELVRKLWPGGETVAPKRLLQGVPDHVDGRMLEVVGRAGGHIVNQDRMWHYPEGITNFAPIWNRHGIRILSGPSVLWLDATGRPLPAPLYPGFDTLGALRHVLAGGYDYSWFVLNHRIVKKEFALSGSEQNPDLTNGGLIRVVRERLRGRAPAPVRAFLQNGVDFATAHGVTELATTMNRITGEQLIDPAMLEKTLKERDSELANINGKTGQVAAVRGARKYIGERLVRVAPPHPLLDPKAGPLIAVRLSILTRKSLGGIQIDLSGRVLRADGTSVPGLFAAGEAAGFGGGGMHGYRALEGTFLGGCIFSGRTAGKAAAQTDNIEQ